MYFRSKEGTIRMEKKKYYRDGMNTSENTLMPTEERNLQCAIKNMNGLVILKSEVKSALT